MTHELNPQQQTLTAQLFEIGAVKFGDYKIKLHENHPEAPLSPVYVDLRVVRRFPEVKRAAVDVYQMMLDGLEYDLLSDVPTAATPYVSTLSDRLNVGVITPRTDDKKYGSGAKIDGMQSTDVGLTSVVIDDLVSGAESKLEAVSALRNAGIKVKDVVVLIDREQGGREQLTNNALELHNALTLDPMIEFYLTNETISQSQYDRVKQGMEVLREYQRLNS